MLLVALGDQNHEQYTSMARPEQLDVELSVVEQKRRFLQECGNIETTLHCAKCQYLNVFHQFYRSMAALSGKMSIAYS